MITTKIQIPEDLVNYIEGLQYDVEGMKDLIVRMSNYQAPEENNSYWANLYLKKNAEYNMAKQELVTQYIEPVVENKPCNWSLNFNSGELTIEYEDYMTVNTGDDDEE